MSTLKDQSTIKLKKKAELVLTVDSIAYGGQGIARWNDFVVFVKNGLPGDRLRVRITKKRKSFAEAVILEIIEPSRNRITPRCKYAGTCGGCKWQQYDYAEQLKGKHQIVKDCFERIGNFSSLPIEETLACPIPFYYRNKMEFSFGARRWLFPEEIEGELEKSKTFALGLHVAGRFDRVLDIDTCYLQSELSSQIVNTVRKEVLRCKLSPYNVNTHEGFMRFLMIREGEHTGDLMVNFITAKDNPQKLKPVVEKLKSGFPQITSIVNNINLGKAHISHGEKEYLLWGKSTIREKLKEYIFEISANSFFQTNTYQAEQLYDAILDLAAFEGSEKVYDLYCGAGAIALYISRYVKEVIGVEIVSDAIQDAKRNTKLNGVNNCQFIEGDLKETIDQLIETPDVIITDPPRAGMHPSIVEALIKLQAPKLVYVSCNPTTQARDIQKLCEEVYHLERVLPVDMFPHTYHIETVALLVKKL